MCCKLFLKNHYSRDDISFKLITNIEYFIAVTNHSITCYTFVYPIFLYKFSSPMVQEARIAKVTPFGFTLVGVTLAGQGVTKITPADQVSYSNIIS